MPYSGIAKRVVTDAWTPVQEWVAPQPAGTNAKAAEMTERFGSGSQSGTPSPRSTTGAKGPKPSSCSSVVTEIPYGRKMTATGSTSPGGATPGPSAPTPDRTQSAGSSVTSKIRGPELKPLTWSCTLTTVSSATFGAMKYAIGLSASSICRTTSPSTCVQAYV